MNYFEIKTDGKAYIRTDSGTVIREVGDGAPVAHADLIMTRACSQLLMNREELKYETAKIFW